MSDELREFLEDKIDSDHLSLANMKGGAAIEMFDLQLHRVMQNIADINTDLKPRVIKLEVAIQPVDENRSMVAMAINVPPAKLSGQEPIKTLASVKIDANGKGFYAKAHKDPQQQLPFNVKTIKQEE